MRVISYKAIREFATKYPDSKEPLDKWYKAAQQANWQNISDVKEQFPHADAIGDCTCFNIGGNKYRLIVKIKYQYQVIYIRFILTHSEYDKGAWKNDC